MRYQETGKLINEFRTKANLTQKEVSEKLGTDYTSTQFISNWERGLAPPPLKTMAKLAQVLKIDKEKLMKAMLKDSQKNLELKLSKVLKIKAS